MRRDVIHFGRLGVLTSFKTINTPWFLDEVSRAHDPPPRTVVQLLDCGITDDALGGMSHTSPALDQYIAAGICALAQR